MLFFLHHTIVTQCQSPQAISILTRRNGNPDTRVRKNTTRKRCPLSKAEFNYTTATIRTLHKAETDSFVHRSTRPFLETCPMARPIDPAKRPAILNAARTVFLEKGYTETRMSEIAVRAGVAVGTLYLYFDSKEAIARAMAETFFQRLEVAVVPEIEPTLLGADAEQVGGVTPNRFRQLIHHAFTIAIEERELLLLSPSGFLDAGASPHAQEARAQFFHRLGAVLASLMAVGRVRRYEDPVVLAELIVALSQPVIRTYITLGENDRERYEAMFVEILEHALLVPPTSLNEQSSTYRSGVERAMTR
jgi:AcrR family transcriptional regulator